MVIVLAIELKVRGFKPGQGRWIFNGDKNHSMTSVPCHVVLRRVKDPCNMKEIFRRQNSR
jgi:hypothetical protein